MAKRTKIVEVESSFKDDLLDNLRKQAEDIEIHLDTLKEKKEALDETVRAYEDAQASLESAIEEIEYNVSDDE